MKSSENRKEKIRAYKLRPQQAGIFQIRNKVSCKFLLGSSLNLDGILNRHQFTLKMGSHKNPELQKDWKEYGESAFKFEILEEIDIEQEAGFKLEDELQLLEEIWIEKLNPYGEMGYNTATNIRRV